MATNRWFIRLLLVPVSDAFAVCVPWEGHVPSPLPTLLYHVASRSATPLCSPSRNGRGISVPPVRSSSSSLGQNCLCRLRYAIRLVGETAPGEDEDQHREHDDDESQEQEYSCRRNHWEPVRQGYRRPIRRGVQERDDDDAALCLVENPRPGDPGCCSENNEEHKVADGEWSQQTCHKEGRQMPQSPE